MALDLREDLKQPGFRSPQHEALLSILRTADVIKYWLAVELAGHGLSLGAYNVLRILRGSGKNGLPTLEISKRMIERAPGITRLVDGLNRKNLVRRKRTGTDRRVVVCQITDGGLAHLKALDPKMDAVDLRLGNSLTLLECQAVIQTLGKVRGKEESHIRKSPNVSRGKAMKSNR